MASFRTEFHATIDELGDLVESWMDKHPIVISAFAFPPEHRVPITRETIREVLARPAVLVSLTFTENAVDPEVASAYDVASWGYEPLILEIGRLEPRGLAQSWLAAKYVQPIWKAINADVKKKTTAGADLVWEDGRTGFDRNARFTAGAKALAAAGTPLRQWPAQSTYIYLPK